MLIAYVDSKAFSSPVDMERYMKDIADTLKHAKNFSALAAPSFVRIERLDISNEKDGVRAVWTCENCGGLIDGSKELKKCPYCGGTFVK